MSNSRIYPGVSLKHLGFLWNVGHKRLQTVDIDHQNITERLNKFWSVIHGLIKAGIRSCAPNTRITLFRSLAIPTLTYGLELCKLGEGMKNKLDIEGRRALKLLFGVSRFSRNYLNQLFNIQQISDIILKNKINLCHRLTKNVSTKPLILNMLLQRNNDNFMDELVNKGIDVFGIVLSGKQVPIIQDGDNEIPEDISAVLKNCIGQWDLKESRERFRGILEENVPL